MKDQVQNFEAAIDQFNREISAFIAGVHDLYEKA